MEKQEMFLIIKLEITNIQNDWDESVLIIFGNRLVVVSTEKCIDCSLYVRK